MAIWQYPWLSKHPLGQWPGRWGGLTCLTIAVLLGSVAHAQQLAVPEAQSTATTTQSANSLLPPANRPNATPPTAPSADLAANPAAAPPAAGITVESEAPPTAAPTAETGASTTPATANAAALLEAPQPLWPSDVQPLASALVAAMQLPSNSPALNGWARDLLTRTPPVTESENNYDTARITQLRNLGELAAAWKIAAGQRTLASDFAPYALLQPELRAAVCEVAATLPPPVQITCHVLQQETDQALTKLLALRKDPAALLDPLFAVLVERSANPQLTLPRQLTPLRPLNLVLLEHLGQKLPGSGLARAESFYTQILLRLAASDSRMRLTLAEQAAARGQISPAQLAEIYTTHSISVETRSSANNTANADAETRAALWQLYTEAPAANHLALIARMATIGSGEQLTGSYGALLLQAARQAAAAPELPLSQQAGLARLALLQNDASQATQWLQPMIAAPNDVVASRILLQLLPLRLLAGLVPASTREVELAAWLNRPADAARPVAAHRQWVLAVLLASGVELPLGLIARQITPPPERQRMPAVDPLNQALLEYTCLNRAPLLPSDALCQLAGAQQVSRTSWVRNNSSHSVALLGVLAASGDVAIAQQIAREIVAQLEVD